MIGRKRRIHVEVLMGRRVRDPAGKSIGHIAEVCARPDARGHLVVYEYRLRRHKLLDSISIAGVASSLVRLLGGHSADVGLNVPWDQMDLTDPRRPRTRCAAEELVPK